MFDVLTFLFEQYPNLEDCPDRPALTQQLEAAGFEDDEIVDALDWMTTLAESVDRFDDMLFSSGIRLYAESEQERLPLEVRGLVQFLEDNGALNPAQRELVIDRLLALPDDEISAPAAKLVTLLVLWSQNAELPVLLGEELLEAIHGQPTMQ